MSTTNQLRNYFLINHFMLNWIVKIEDTVDYFAFSFSENMNIYKTF